MPNALHFYGEFAPFASGRRNVARLATRPRRACIVFINLAPGSSYALEILESWKLKIAFQATFWILLQDISILLGQKLTKCISLYNVTSCLAHARLPSRVGCRNVANDPSASWPSRAVDEGCGELFNTIKYPKLRTQIFFCLIENGSKITIWIDHFVLWMWPGSRRLSAKMKNHLLMHQLVSTFCEYCFLQRITRFEINGFSNVE